MLSISKRFHWLTGFFAPAVFSAALALAAVGTMLSASFAAAQDASWLATATVAGPDAGTFDYNVGANWSGGTVPTGTATFGATTTPVISFAPTTSVTVGGWLFATGAAAYEITLENGGVGALVDFTGTGITVNGGSLSLTNNTNVRFDAGSLTASGGSLTFTNNGSLAFAGDSTGGNAALINNTGGVIDFSASAGPGGDGKVSAGSISGAGNIYLGADALTVGGNNLSTTYSGVISDCGATGTDCAAPATGGSLVKTGTGTLTLSGVNTYTGGTTVSAGILQAGVADAFGSGGVSIDSGATLDLNNFSQTIGSLVGAGNVTLGSATLTAGADNSSSIFSGVISGTGGLTKTGAGTLTLSGANTYTGETLVDAGTLRAGAVNAFSPNSAVNQDGGTTLDLNSFNQAIGSLLGNGFITLGSATLTVGGNNASTLYHGVISGTGGLTKIGTASLGLSGASTYSGATTISGGTLRAGAINVLGINSAVTVGEAGILNLGVYDQAIGSLAGSGSVVLGATLTTGGDNTSTGFSGVLSSTGDLVKTGTGTQTLAGINTYTGDTTVNGGVLSVDGSIASSAMTTVNAGGALSGSGTVGNTTINDGGTLAPGSTTGVLSVQGSLVLTSAANYLVEVTPTSAGRVNVTGTATLGGATVSASFANGSYISKQYTIVNATGGAIGTFNALVNTNLPASFTSALSYDASNAYLDLTLNYAPVGASSSGPTPPSYNPLNLNQQNVGNALVSYFNRNGGIPLVFGALNANGLTQVSGELATAVQQTSFDAMNLFMGLMTDPFTAGRAIDGASAAQSYASTQNPRDPRDAHAMFTKAGSPGNAKPATFDARWNVWAAGYGGSRTTDGNSSVGSNTATSSVYGTAVGADYWFSPATVAGFAMAGGGTNFSVANGGNGSSDLFQAGAFVRHTQGSAYVAAALAYGWQDITTDRAVTVSGIDRLHAEYHANSYSARLEGGNRYVLPYAGGIGVSPYAAVQVTALELPGYSETAAGGTSIFALNYGSKTITDPRTELGFRTDKSFAVNDAILTLRGRAAWAHDYNTDRTAAATFQTLPGASFVVNGAAASADSALTTAAAEMTFTNGISLAATFEGEFSDTTTSYAGKGVVRYQW